MNLAAEWLETDGLGEYAMGRPDGIRTRRYNAILAVSRTPPTERMTLVNGIDAWVETEAGSFAISSQRYTPDVTHPDGAARLVTFTASPWAPWRCQLPNGLEVIQRNWSWRMVRHSSPSRGRCRHRSPQCSSYVHFSPCATRTTPPPCVRIVVASPMG